jgi:hypothetical protein
VLLSAGGWVGVLLLLLLSPPQLASSAGIEATAIELAATLRMRFFFIVLA